MTEHPSATAAVAEPNEAQRLASAMRALIDETQAHAALLRKVRASAPQMQAALHAGAYALQERANNMRQTLAAFERTHTQELEGGAA